MFMPAPNFFAGILCGIANNSLITTLQSAFLWGVFWAFWQTLMSFSLVAKEKQNGEAISRAVLFSLEFITAASTAALAGAAAYGVKSLFFA